MGNIVHKVELSDEEVKSLVAVLKYSLDYCPIESISEELSITGDRVEELIIKLERASKAE